MNELAPRNFSNLSYEELEEKNLIIKGKAANGGIDVEKTRQELTNDKGIKAVTLCFSNIEGRLHTLDYDKKFFLESEDNLTFDGSSVRGLSAQNESDLRITADWDSLRWLPADIYTSGKVLMFANIMDREKNPYPTDFRGQLGVLTKELQAQGLRAFASAEIEGFLIAGPDAEQEFDEDIGFSPISKGGYYNSLPRDPLRLFIDSAAEAQRAMGFENEKDHPEVAPSQFEMNWKYTDVLRACDQIQLYKQISRQVAKSMDMTATFLPKPIMDVNGNGMHINFSISRDGKNAFYDEKGKEKLSNEAHDTIARILNHAPELCLVLNSSVNAYRRLDPHFEAPNQIKVSANDRGSMIRIPAGNENSARIEVRSVAPDSNPYLVLYTLLKTMQVGEALSHSDAKRQRTRFLPDNIGTAIQEFKSNDFISKILSEESKKKYAEWKEESAGRSPNKLGKTIKRSEIIYHHEVTNQAIWSKF